MRRERRRADRRRALLAGGGALLASVVILAPLLRVDEEAPRSAPTVRRTPRVAPVERRPASPPAVAVAAPRPAERRPPPSSTGVAHPVAKAPSVLVETAAPPVDPAPLARGSVAPGLLQARADRAERRLLALEKREAVARRFAHARRELGLAEDGPEAQSLRILLGDDSPFRRD